MSEKPDKSNENRVYRKVLTIAGSDSGGGAGIQADIKTFSAIGCFGMSVITALTAQNTRGVFGIHAVPAAFAGKQIEAVFSDMGADAVKIGMLYSAELIEMVAEHLIRFKAANVVLDPVMVAQSGDKLIQDDAIDAIKKRLLPVADVVTPNLPEAEVLLGRKLTGPDEIKRAAAGLSLLGSRNVLIKGGHLTGNRSTDFLYLAETDRFIELSEARVATRNNHGTGCTLSSAIAAYLAKGSHMEDAVRKAKAYIQGAIKAGASYRIGGGSGPVHHFYQFWD